MDNVKNYTAIIEYCPDTKLYVGYIPGFTGAHSQGETIDELVSNLQEVIEMLLEDGEPRMESFFVGVHNINITVPVNG
jgi:predicted RNase H-like HicB family nuclease